MIRSLSFLFVLLQSSSALAHVKWFSAYDFEQSPLRFSDLFSNPFFWGLFALSLVSLPLLVWADRAGEEWGPYQKINHFLDRYADNGPLIMRVAMGAVFLMSWQNNAIIAPEISAGHPFWGWLQFALALCLLFKETTIIAGFGMLVIYGQGLLTQTSFHMLDYMVYPAVGLYLIFSHLKHERLRNLDLPILYSGLGFSLCWVSFEKMLYPFWGLSVLAKAPALTMGLDHEFFLLACAFVEFTLGYLLIICLLHRPLAVIITLVFFTTTAFFGKTEVVGHTILHGALLVFIVRGPGHYYQAPIRIHRSLWMRSLFAAVNFVLLFVLLAYPYQILSRRTLAEAKSQTEMDHPRVEVPADVPVPTVSLAAYKDIHGGWNLNVTTTNFTFTPEVAGSGDAVDSGHAHLYLDGKKIGRVYGKWTHVNLPQGTHTLRLTLNTNSHKDLFFQGKAIEALVKVEEDRKGAVHAH